MKVQQLKKWGVLVCALALVGAVLAGCAGGTSPEAEQQAKNRQFMAQINQTMVDLNEKLDAFNEAVATGSVVNMRTQADNAFRVLDSLENLEAPEGLEDIKQDYIDGATELEGALFFHIPLPRFL